jgi:hypothetical protein
VVKVSLVRQYKSSWQGDGGGGLQLLVRRWGNRGETETNRSGYGRGIRGWRTRGLRKDGRGRAPRGTSSLFAGVVGGVYAGVEGESGTCVDADGGLARRRTPDRGNRVRHHFFSRLQSSWDKSSEFQVEGTSVLSYHGHREEQGWRPGDRDRACIRASFCTRLRCLSYKTISLNQGSDAREILEKKRGPEDTPS